MALGVIGAVGIGLDLIGTGISTYGQWKAQKAAAKAAEFNLQGLELEAEGIRRQAGYIADRFADIEASKSNELRKFDRESKKFLGDMMDDFSQAGVSLSGSALNILADSIEEIDHERDVIERNYEIMTGNNEKELEMTKLRAKMADKKIEASRYAARAGQSNLPMIGTVLGGVASAGRGFISMDQQGMFDFSSGSTGSTASFDAQLAGMRTGTRNA